MKRIITILLLSISLAANAQTPVSDSVVMGQYFNTDFFYSFKNGKVGSMNSANWDLGFESALEGGSIIVNNAIGDMLYRVPNQDTLNWNSLDTAGINNWTPVFNSDTTWERGAFNSGVVKSNPYDYGWGTYQPSVYNVYGDDSVYILKSGTPFVGPFTYKKIRIISKLGIPNLYIFRIANLDNSEDHTDTLRETGYSSKNFAYYNIAGNTFINPEPDASAWDILFTQYIDIPYNQCEPPLTGVLSNKKVQVVKVPNVPDINNVNYQDYSSGLTTNLTAIGYNWKSYDEVHGKFHLLDSLVYFVKTTDGNIYKLWFTAFNFGTGGIHFNYSNVALTAVSTIKGEEVKASIYPNPAIDNFNLVYSTPESSDAEVSVFDITGRIVLNEKLNVNKGLNIIQLSSHTLTNGTYFLKVAQDGSVINQKIMVTK